MHNIIRRKKIGSLDTFPYDDMKVRKALVSYIVFKSLHFNTVEKTNLEDMLTEGFHLAFETLSLQFASTI